jgi:hypothetical protein
MKRNLKIGTCVNNWIVMSEPIIKNGKRCRNLKCNCGKEELISESYINKANFSKSCRSCSQIRRRNEIGGRVYNVGDILMNLKILKIHSGKYVSYTVKCNNCGNIYHTGHSILNKKSKGLGLPCCNKCFNVEMKSKKTSTMVTKNISLTQYNKIQRQAELRGIEFDVTPEYLESIFTGYCYFSGIELKIGTYVNNKDVRDLGNASLDRIDSNIGYIEGNVAWVYKPINIMKQTLSSAEFIILCKKIAEHNKKHEILVY